MLTYTTHIETVTYFDDNQPEISGYGAELPVIFHPDTSITIGECRFLPSQLQHMLKLHAKYTKACDCFDEQE